MIVLSSNDESTYKPQSSLYRLLPHYGITLPLTRAIICHCLAQNDTSGAFFIKAPLSFLLFTLHQIGWNPDKHWGCERWRVTLHSSPLFTTVHLRIAHGIESEARPVRPGAETTFFTSHRFLQIFRKRLRVKSGWRVAQALHPCKFLSYRYLCPSGEEWRVFLKVAYYSGGLQISQNAWWGGMGEHRRCWCEQSLCYSLLILYKKGDLLTIKLLRQRIP